MSVAFVVLRRLSLVVAGVLSVAGGASILGFAAGLWATPTLILGGVELQLGTMETHFWTPAGLVLLLAGLLVFVVALWPTGRVASYGITLPSSIDQDGLVVRVTPATLKKLIQFEARQVNGVRAIQPAITSEDAGWRVHCHLVVWRGRSMRDVSEEVTERIRDALHRHTGVNLSNLELDVSLAPEPATRVE